MDRGIHDSRNVIKKYTTLMWVHMSPSISGLSPDKYAPVREPGCIYRYKHTFI